MIFECGEPIDVRERRLGDDLRLVVLIVAAGSKINASTTSATTIPTRGNSASNVRSISPKATSSANRAGVRWTSHRNTAVLTTSAGITTSKNRMECGRRNGRASSQGRIRVPGTMAAWSRFLTCQPNGVLAGGLNHMGVVLQDGLNLLPIAALQCSDVVVNIFDQHVAQRSLLTDLRHRAPHPVYIIRRRSQLARFQQARRSELSSKSSQWAKIFFKPAAGRCSRGA